MDQRVAPRDVQESLEQGEQVDGLLLPADLTMVGCVELSSTCPMSYSPRNVARLTRSRARHARARSASDAYSRGRPGPRRRGTSGSDITVLPHTPNICVRHDIPFLTAQVHQGVHGVPYRLSHQVAILPSMALKRPTSAELVADLGGRLTTALVQSWQIDAVAPGSERLGPASLLDDEVRSLIGDIAVATGFAAESVVIGEQAVPGFFQRERTWSVAATVNDNPLVSVGVMSVGVDSGPSMDELVNRALAQMTDTWAGSTSATKGSLLRPWLGYIARVHDGGAETAASTADCLDRMVRHRLLDAACVAEVDATTGEARFPVPTLAAQSFVAALIGRCLVFRVAGAGEPVSLPS